MRLQEDGGHVLSHDTYCVTCPCNGCVVQRHALTLVAMLQLRKGAAAPCAYTDRILHGALDALCHALLACCRWSFYVAAALLLQFDASQHRHSWPASKLLCYG
jgi:hypothetical protein